MDGGGASEEELDSDDDDLAEFSAAGGSDDVDFSHVPADHVKKLKADKSLSAQFDKTYGKGTAQAILRPKPKKKPPPPKKPRKKSLDDDAFGSPSKAHSINYYHIWT